MSKIRWGILGTGRIAGLYADALKYCTDCAEITAVGSRTYENAAKFAEKYDIPNVYGSYAEFVECPDVDVVYIASPNTSHYEHSLMALKAGKGVLCEKPLMINAAEAIDLIEYARERNLFFCEAMWSRFFPCERKVREWLDDKLIGEIRLVSSDFGFNAPVNPESRIFKPELGGGALIDMGVYTIAFATMVYGDEAPLAIKGTAYMCETGVDGVTNVSLQYPNGVASLSCGVVCGMPNRGVIHGHSGRIEFDRFWASDRVKLIRYGKEDEVFECPYECNGYEYEIREVARCIDNGLIESPYITHKGSVNIMNIMDEVRRQIGLIYPDEHVTSNEN